MRATGFIVFGLFVGLMCLAQTVKPRPAIKTIYDNHLLDLMTVELTVKNLQQVYGKELRISKTTKNEYEPTVRDKILAANTDGDELEIFKNRYNAFLLGADFTSRRLAFGHGIRVGATKAAFCKAYHLSPGYDLYMVIENPESGCDMSFRFERGVLVEVMYRVNHTD